MDAPIRRSTLHFLLLDPWNNPYIGKFEECYKGYSISPLTVKGK
jgi:hypothetical protein